MKVSVAMATFNGEKYIREQLASILDQTLQVDEIIVSDDGSKDETLEIVESFQDKRIRIICSNPNHGYCGNFEWAIKHTTGDVVFLADQDDVWRADKVERTVEVLMANPDIELVISNARMINKYGDLMDGHFNNTLEEKTGRVKESEYMGRAVWRALANGMCMCFTRSLVADLIPFPDSTTCHDKWIGFCALLRDSVYFLNESLVDYRIHDTNTSMKGNLSLRKRFQKTLAAVYNEPYNLYNTSVAMIGKLKNCAHDDILNTVKEIMRTQYKQIHAFKSNPVFGAYQLLKLYATDNIYANNGLKYLLIQLLLVLFCRKYLKIHHRKCAELKDCV